VLLFFPAGQVPATVTSLKVNNNEASQASVPVGLPVLAGKVLAEHWIVTLGGQLILGGVLSLIVINCVQLLELPQSSVANQVRVTAVIWGHPPAATLSVKVMVGVPSQLSVAVAVPVFAG
jgi:hypothetical protein